ncbi:MAG: hypothetical protein K2G05_04190 [Duncaniella sp.]|nr:hypothetical protein [Duncaniella sp.]MDE6065662.1 hypothetical protein [Duncaniella sp.]
MDKNSTSTTPGSHISGHKSATPSLATMSRIRQFARSYVYYQQAAPMGGIILN